MAQRVNLDAMIFREDIAIDAGEYTLDLLKDFPLVNLNDSNPISKLLRKPDFQRETNHWSPEQVVSLIESFLDNEVIPGLILWKSPRHIFVLDGGHRLSALRAWMTDDYGDGPITAAFYKAEISKDQKKAANRVRKLVASKIGTFKQLEQIVGKPDSADATKTRRADRAFTRALSLQWVQGTKAVAESSFFKINSQGTPLDPTETLLIKNRKKPIAISARAILRAGTGNKYWADFPIETQSKFEEKAKEFYNLLFEPESERPTRTLDLPLAGSVSPVDALAVLIEFLTIAGAQTPNKPKTIDQYDDDSTGEGTIGVVTRALEILNRVTGNSHGSLGLHPAVYFYTENGKHNRYMFLGMIQLVAERVRNNDDGFFKKLTKSRSRIEDFLLENKSWIGLLLTNMSKGQRVIKTRDLFTYLISGFDKEETITPETTISYLGLKGRFFDVELANNYTKKVSDDTKSSAYLEPALASAVKCQICGGRMDANKSMSYDHKTRIRDGGDNSVENIQLSHPYCNTGFKS
jgi:Protein of unknown function DUF262/HNH endonuclease